MEKKDKKELKRSPYKLIGDFPTQKKKYKKGDTIQATVKGAAYLRTIKKIK